MSPSRPIVTFQARIDKVNHQAEANIAISEFSKKTVALPKTLEGDLWQITAEKRGRRYRLTQTELLEPSPDRIKPYCIHFDKCGGCKWQHAEVEKQLNKKNEWVAFCLKDLIKPSTLWHLPIGSTTDLNHLKENDYEKVSWHYRNKMEFSFAQSREGERNLGLHLNRSQVLNIQQCQIAPQWFNPTLERVRLWWRDSALDAYNFHNDSGSLRTLTLRTSHDNQKKMVILNVSGNADYALSQQQINKFKEAILSDENLSEEVSIFITIQQCIPKQPTRFFELHIHGPECIEEEITIFDETFKFSISPSTFFQPNLKMAHILYRRAMEIAKIENHELVWDLFCGSGTLSIIASKWARQVIGVEVNPMAILDAKANAQANYCTKVSFECADLHKDVSSALNQLMSKGHPDVVMVDPPRVGLLERGARQLAELAPKRILYISCNPLSLAEDIKSLKDSGYYLSELQVIDQFTHTGHVETICMLIKEN
jgi:23S rRNA (uracil1939-C5)-methyltransferase